MQPFIKEFLAYPMTEQVQVLKVAMAPYDTRMKNIRLWAYITFLITIYAWVTYDFGTIIAHHTTGVNHWTKLIIFYIFAGFSIFYWCFWCVLIDALRRRLADERQQMAKIMESNIAAQNRVMIENVRVSSGRKELSDDPISIMAATIDAIYAPGADKVDPAINPLRGALDGTLRPRHLSNPEDDTTDTQEF